MKYFIDGLLKFAEEDNWENGCTGDGSSCWIDYKLESDTVKDLIEQIKEFLSINSDCDYQVNPCEDDPSRIDFSVTENADGDIPNKSESVAFRKGDINLYYCIYTVNVKRMDAVDVLEALQ